MDRTFLGNLKKFRSLLVAQQRPLQPDLQLDVVYLPFLAFAIGAVLCMDP